MPARSTDPPLPQELVELVALRLGALGDPTRVRLLDTLRRCGEASVGELAQAAGAGYANAAKHLALLHRERILARRKEGARVIYRIADPTVFAICELVCSSLAAQVRDLDALVTAVSAGELSGRDISTTGG
ncbi:MAG TPA: metalloregulator ArsR/SmtB family transcription factor [Solirubrobacteraceae bacterium]|nr:metalloregulator ArsR/SmtB family transcription factor [Solirubrobacteraceae bacterium]